MGACAGKAPQDEPGTEGKPAPAKKKTAGPPATTVRLVLLGQGESGKSTIFKQMRILQAQDEGAPCFTDQERNSAKSYVYANVVTQMKLLAKVALDEEMEFSSEAAKEVAAKLVALPTEDVDRSCTAVGDMLKALWADGAIKDVYAERDRLFNINDSSAYFFDKLGQLYEPAYEPDDADLLRLRLRTIGFEEATFVYKGVGFHVVDVGGQRSERRKWEPHINAANALLLVASMCEWDQRLREDFAESRLAETVSLFKELMEMLSSQAAKKSFILLLNKQDLFEEKFKTPRKSNFNKAFPDYKGPLEPKPCAEHMRKTFFGLAGKRQMSVHFVIAVQTDNVKIMWNDVRAQLMESALSATFQL